MSKLSKLKRDPKLFFRDSAKKRLTQILVSLDKKENTEKVANKNNLSQRKTTVSEKSVDSGATNKKAVKSTDNSRIEVPGWYQPNISRQLQGMMNSTNNPIFLYLPWIVEHGNVLINKIASEDYDILPFDLARGIDPLEKRRDIFRFAKNHPAMYKKMVYKRLIPLANKVDGFIFTFDWAPIMRIIVQVCNDLGIKTILIPHESVFVDRTKYYWDPYANASVPICDIILCWGQLQKDIFVERGYPSDNVHIVGAPKFDSYFNYSPQLTRKKYYNLFGLDPSKKTVLFASQPLDSQLDIRVARDSQRQAINDIYEFVKLHDMQLIIRLPPSSDNILTHKTYREIQDSEYAAIDDSLCYIVGPEETIYHNDVIASINSTMLFEGVLAGKFAFSTKYVEFEQIWENAGIPSVSNKNELEQLLTSYLNDEVNIDSAGLEWASSMFGVGSFDGKAHVRITSILEKVAHHDIKISSRKPSLYRLISSQPIDHLGYINSKDLGESFNENLKNSFNAQSVKFINPRNSKISELASLEAILSLSGYENDLILDVSRELATPIIDVERLLLSDSYDDKSYLSLVRQSSIKKLNYLREAFLHDYEKIKKEVTFNNPFQSDDLIEFYEEDSNTSMERIVVFDSGVLSSNPTNPSNIERIEVFERMIKDIIATSNSNKNIIVVKEFYDIDKEVDDHFLNYILKKYSYINQYSNHAFNIIPYQFEISSILKDARSVSTLDSILGIEAILAGVKVKCYSPSIYSNWGLTDDVHYEEILEATHDVNAPKLYSWIFNNLIK